MSGSIWRLSALPFVVAALLLVGMPEYPVLSRAIARVVAESAQGMAAVESEPVPVELSAAPKAVGMSSWAFGFALAGQAADIVTTEIGLADGLREANGYMGRRAVRVPMKLGLPLLSKWMTRKLPRRQANTMAVVLGAGGASAAAWNVSAIMRW